MAVHVEHVLAQGLLCSEGSGDVLELLLNQLFGLTVGEMVKSQLQTLLRLLRTRSYLLFAESVLSLEPFVLLLHHVQG